MPPADAPLAVPPGRGVQGLGRGRLTDSPAQPEEPTAKASRVPTAAVIDAPPPESVQPCCRGPELRRVVLPTSLMGLHVSLRASWGPHVHLEMQLPLT